MYGKTTSAWNAICKNLNENVLLNAKFAPAHCHYRNAWWKQMNAGYSCAWKNAYYAREHFGNGFVCGCFRYGYHAPVSGRYGFGEHCEASIDACCAGFGRYPSVRFATNGYGRYARGYGVLCYCYGCFVYFHFACHEYCFHFATNGYVRYACRAVLPGYFAGCECLNRCA